MALPSSWRTSSGNERMAAALAAGWKIAALAGLMSHIRDIRSRQKRALRTARSRKSVQIAWNLLAGGAYHLAGGWTMYCDGCGNQLTSGGQFCTKCGKPIVPSGVASATAAGRATGQAGAGSTGAYGGPAGNYGVRASTAAGADGRVRRNIHRLATLWMINGILRLLGVGWVMVFGRMFIPPLRGWMGPGFGWSLDSVLSRGIFSAGIILAFFGVLHLVLAWGLFEREPWARFLGLALGFLALLRFPLGTALGIYTLWVLLPERSGAEYERMTQGGGA